jgi:hypothetical protein
MSAAGVPAAVRRLVARRADFLCEYCRSPADVSPSSFSVEHIEPLSRTDAKTDDPANLAWSCMGCNNRKYTAIDAIDPVTGELTPLFHPRRDRWDEHFAWVAELTQVVGVTPVGRATVMRLNLNREELVKLRRILHDVGEHPAIKRPRRDPV